MLEKTRRMKSKDGPSLFVRIIQGNNHHEGACCQRSLVDALPYSYFRGPGQLVENKRRRMHLNWYFVASYKKVPIFPVRRLKLISQSLKRKDLIILSG